MPSNIEEYVIAREEHQDGNFHLHAFLKYEKKVQWTATRWDIDSYHGNYQQAKCWKAVQHYCKKGGQFIASIDTESAAQKRGKKNMHILTGDLQELVQSGAISALQIPQALKARASWNLLGPPVDQPENRGIWIYGDPGIGKSHYVRTKEPSLFLKSQNRWWDGYKGEEAALIDDFDKRGECLDHYLKNWADRWAFTGEIKGYTVPINIKRLYITSNYTIEQLWPDDPVLLEALQRRFKVIHMTDRRLGLVKRPPN